MSNQIETPPVESAFGTSFEAALAEAFEAAGTSIEPSSPKPDVVVEPKMEAVVEPEVKPEKVIPATIEEVEDKEEHDIQLPIDEEVPEVEEEPDTTGMTKTAGERFKALRAEQKALKLELATKAQAEAAALARVKELEAVTGNAEQLKQELEALKLK